MTINRYTLGDLVRCSGRFEDIDEVAHDPGIVTFKVRKPGTPTITTYTYGADAEVVKDGVGLYHVDVLTDMAGRWHYRFAGTNSGQAADEHEFHVEPSRFD